MSLSIRKNFNEVDKFWNFRIGGEIDISNADQLRDELKDAYSEIPANFNINIADLSYMDSTGLGVIIGIYGKLKENGHTVLLLEPRENIKKLLRITNLDKVLL